MGKGSLCLSLATGCGGQTRALAAAEMESGSRVVNWRRGVGAGSSCDVQIRADKILFQNLFPAPQPTSLLHLPGTSSPALEASKTFARADGEPKEYWPQALKEMESKVKNLRDDNNRLRGELLDKDRQLAVTRTLLVDRERQLTKTQTLLADREQQLEARTLLVDTKEFETEILRLKHLLAEGEPWRSGKAAAL
ncbi:uncharacterized protein [Triticum aestivum]|uniref:uncharacterized protein n=1 Tax=Triticum aestivum TaxID=4565 RepID=UPI001D01BA22|nr:uncharacterized protein LOC123061081 [Triticum aestivum]